VNLHADILARAEGTTHAGEMEPHAFRWEIETGRQLFEIRVEPLGGDEEVDAAVGGSTRRSPSISPARPGAGLGTVRRTP